MTRGLGHIGAIVTVVLCASACAASGITDETQGPTSMEGAWSVPPSTAVIGEAPVADPASSEPGTSMHAEAPTTGATGSEDLTFSVCASNLRLGDAPGRFGLVSLDGDPTAQRSKLGYLAAQLLDSSGDPIAEVSFGVRRGTNAPRSVDVGTQYSAVLSDFEDGLVLVVDSISPSQCSPMVVTTFRLDEAEVVELFIAPLR
jgi:hypothetical protein